jgi:nitroimidazol reductase NimA-like FMN-containing flavoprotein (pyridoxamine 5'-phosphate oxidase superfamily)
VGRVAVWGPEGPAVVPVNYLVTGDSVAYRTAPGSLPAAADGRPAAFETDQVDEAMSQGWSVLVVGTGRAADGDRARELERLAYTEPWPGGERELWLEIPPEKITGRRLVTGPGPP